MWSWPAQSDLQKKKRKKKRHSSLRKPHTRLKKQPQNTHVRSFNATNMCFIGVYVVFFPTHRCHLGRGQPRGAALFLMAMVQNFVGASALTQVRYFVKFRQNCAISVSKKGRGKVVEKKKRVANKHQRKHTTTRKEGGRKVLVKSPLTQCQPRHDGLVRASDK